MYINYGIRTSDIGAVAAYLGNTTYYFKYQTITIDDTSEISDVDSFYTKLTVGMTLGSDYHKGKIALQGVYAVEYYYTYNDNGRRKRAQKLSKVLLLQKFD